MKIYTSYFAVEKWIPSDVTRISIARWLPKGLRYMEYKQLAPSEKSLRAYKDGIIDEDGAGRSYRKGVLSKIKLEDVLAYFELVGNGSDVVLLCFEKSTDYCHRHILAEWFIEQGIQVDEYPIQKS